jgi:two-component system chemotaxis response regulator CheB
LKVLIVDDSVVFRSQIRLALDGQSGIEVVGVASNGKIALERLEQIQVDLVVLDVEMSVLSGLETLREIRRRNFKVKVIMFSFSTQIGSETTLAALAAGAEDFAAKPTASDGSGDPSQQPAEKIRLELLPKVLQFSDQFLRPAASPQTAELSSSQLQGSQLSQDLEGFMPQVIVIGSSTGGPTALEEVLKDLRGRSLRCPILIVQHMPPVFTAALASRIQGLIGIPTREPVHQEVVGQQIYIAPGNFHMVLKKVNSELRILINQDPPQNSVRPAVDPLFDSASKVYGNLTMGVVLTGMGCDGALGAQRIKSEGGCVMIQDQESCVVYGMPRAVFEVGAFDEIGNLEQIRNRITKMACGPDVPKGNS